MKRFRMPGCNTPLYEYQVEGRDAIFQEFGGRCLLADSMGLGKTIQCLAAGHKYAGPPGECRWLVVCPASLKGNWEYECRRHFGYRTMVLEGSSPSRTGVGRIPRGVVPIINYDILEGWLPLLRKYDPDYVVFDEAQMLGSRDSLRTKCSREIAKVAPYVVCATGTPMMNRPAELWPMLNMLKPKVWPSFPDFAARYCDPKRTHWGWSYRGATNMPELNRMLLKHVMVRRRQDDVLKFLPQHNRVVVPLVLSPAAMKEYRAAELDFLSWLRKTHPQRASKARKADRLVKMGYLKRLAAELKRPQVKLWIDNYLESEPKLLAFGVHRSMVRQFHELYGSRRAALVDGGVPKRLRQVEFERFNTDPGCALFFGNLEAGGKGWSCRSSNAVCFPELDWTPGQHEQAEKRVRGVGRGLPGKPSFAYYLPARGTIEEKILAVLQEKKTNLDAGIDGRGDGKTDLNIFDMLEESYVRGA